MSLSDPRIYESEPRGVSKFPPSHPKRPLNDELKERVFNRILESAKTRRERTKDLSEKFGISIASVQKIMYGKGWARREGIWREINT